MALVLACSVDDRAVGTPDRTGSGAGGTTGTASSACGESCPGVAPSRGGACSDGQRRCVDGAPEACASGAWLSGAVCSEPLGFCLARSGAVRQL
jgi:hypothetical protein